MILFFLNLIESYQYLNVLGYPYLLKQPTFLNRIHMIFDINFVILYKFYSLFLMANLIKTFIVKHQRLLSVNCFRSINEPA